MNAKWSVMQAYAPCFAASFAFVTIFFVLKGDLTSMRSVPTLFFCKEFCCVKHSVVVHLFYVFELMT